jgi:uncharacterized surface protein with fasciclin (FAS1) repeats
MRRAADALFAAVMFVSVLHAGARRTIARAPLAPDPPAKSVNLTEILTLDGPFGTFLRYLQQTDLVQVFQREAYRTDHGITILVPVNRAFAAVDPSVIMSRTTRPSFYFQNMQVCICLLKKMQVLSGLSRHHLKDLMLYHSLAKRYELAEFEELSRINPVTTLAGRPYTVNVTYNDGTIHVRSSWAEAKIVGSVSAAVPMAVYELDRVLLPDSLFPAQPSVAEAPAPVPTNGAPPESYPAVPSEYGSAGIADAPSLACRPAGAPHYVTYAAAVAFSRCVGVV